MAQAVRANRSETTRESAPSSAAGAGAGSWIYGVGSDLIISLGWVPVLLGVLWATRSGASSGVGASADDVLAPLVALTLFASSLHQPLTLGLVYADRAERRARRQLLIWTPLVVVAVIVIAARWTPTLIVPVAAIWNTVHTLQQRYGICRIYSRRAGYGSALLDRLTIYTAMTAAITVVAADPSLGNLVERADLGGRNGDAAEGLVSFQDAAGAAVLPVLLIAAAVVAAWVRTEMAAGSRLNPARVLYMASTLALLAAIAITPAAGFVAYVAAHTIEYVVIVHRTGVRRGADDTDRGLLSITSGRAAWIALGMVAVTVPVLVARFTVPLHELTVPLACLGALHFIYDGIIWKLRRPKVAADFGISTGRDLATAG